MNDSFLEDRNHKWYKIIDGIMVTNEDTFFNTLYMAITKHPTYVICADLETKRKDSILGAMLKHFESKEDFEKCACIFDIKKQIK